MDDEDIVAAVRTLEKQLLDPDTRASADQVDRLIADDFVEFGSSGSRSTPRRVGAMTISDRN
jgi:hypothetical protein